MCSLGYKRKKYNDGKYILEKDTYIDNVIEFYPGEPCPKPLTISQSLLCDLKQIRDDLARKRKNYHAN